MYAIMAPDGQKMSKSKGNVIDPMEVMDSGWALMRCEFTKMSDRAHDMMRQGILVVPKLIDS